MAKDPAILWYWNDWNGGTSTFTRHLKGCYIDLLSSQFNSGRLSLAEIKTVLGADFGPTWPSLQKKFRKDENGLYYNERMEDEKEKRKKFTDGRKKNLEGSKKKHHMGSLVGNGMENHVEDVIENGNVFRGKEGSPRVEKEVTLSPEGFYSDTLDKSIDLTDLEIGATIEYLRYTVKKVLDTREVVERWEAFKIKWFSIHEWYNSYEKLISHFRDSLKFEFNNGGTIGKSKNNLSKPVISGTATGAGTI